MKLRFEVHIRAVLRLDSGLSHNAIIYQPKMLVVGDHIALKKQQPSFLTFLLCKFQMYSIVI